MTTPDSVLTATLPWLHALPDPALLVDLADRGRVRHANPAAARHFGLDLLELRERALDALWPDLAAHLAFGGSRPQTFRLRGGGPWAWVDARTFPVGDLLAVQLTDASAQRDAEVRGGVLFDLATALSQALTAEEAAAVVLGRGLTALEAATGSVFLLDAERGELVFTGAVGYDEAYMAGWQRFPAVAPTLLGDVLRAGEGLFLSTAEVDARYPHLRVQRAVPTRAVAALPLLFGGRAVGAMNFGFARDPTFDPAQRQFLLALAEGLAQALERARLAEVQARARKVLERQAALLDQAHDGVFTWELGDGITSWNRGAEVLYGYSREEALGQSRHDLLNTDHGGVDVPTLEATLRAQGQWQGTLRHRTRDGREVIVDSRHVLVRGDDGAPDLVLETNRDITEQERARERAALLADVGELLTASPDPQGVLDALAHLVVPRIADWCTVALPDKQGLLALRATAHRDPDRVKVLRRFRERVPIRVDDDHPLAQVLRSGEVFLHPELEDVALTMPGNLEEEDFAAATAAVRARSILAVPLTARGEVLGVLSLVSQTPGHFGAEDLPFARELARRAALALDNARLYTAALESERRYRALIEATDQYVWTNSPEGEMVGEQPGWARLTGQTPQEYRGYGWSESLHPEDRGPAVELWHEALRTRSLYEVEQRVRVQGGSYRSFLVRAVPLLDEDGTLREWVGLHSDVTDLKRAQLMLQAWGGELERQVAARTEELRSQSLALAAFVTFTEAVGSQEGQRDLALRACEVLHATFENGTAVYYEPDGGVWRGVAWAGDLPEATLALVRKGLPGGTVGIAQSVAARDAVFLDGWRDEPDDTARQTREYGTAAFFPVMVGGEVVGLLTAGLLSRARWDERDQAVVRGVGRGLTLAAERAASVRTLREGQEVVEARNRALEGFAVLARDLAFETDPLVLVRRAQEIVLALLPEGFGLYYRPEGGVWRLRVQTGDLRNDALQAVVDAGLPLEETHNLWLPFQSGEAYYQDSYDTGTDGLGDLAAGVGATACLPVRADGSVVGVLAVGLFRIHRWSAVDRALLETAVLMLELAFERSVAARHLAEQQAQLRAANEELGAFAYTVSHDLRAPVRHVGSFAGLLRKKIGDNPGLLKYVDQIEGAATRMETLTDALLGLARAGAAQLNKTAVDLNLLVAAARSDLTPEWSGRNVTWRIGELPVVRADVGLLRQVLANLLSNAVKYSGGREEAVVEVWAEGTPDEVVVAVRDNGAGFDPQYAGKLFGVFQRLHHQSEFEGTGVGLANVKRIVEKHGGRVWAQGRPGEGATFSFSLPRA